MQQMHTQKQEKWEAAASGTEEFNSLTNQEDNITSLRPIPLAWAISD